jgi:hypothetical protein
MNRVRSSQILPLALLVTAAVWAAQAADTHSEAAPATASGAYAVTFHINAPSTIPDGAVVACRARVAPRLPAIEKPDTEAIAAESMQGFAQVINSSAICTVQMPFTFAIRNDSGAALSYEIDAYTAAGPAFVRTQQDIPVALPPSGATAGLVLDVSL